MRSHALESLLIAVCLLSSALEARAGIPAHLWSKTFGDASFQSAYSAAVDANGNIIIVGPFAGAVNFGGSLLTTAGANDVFVAKFDAAGIHQWSQRFGDASEQHAIAVTVDTQGNVIVTGWFSGTVNFGGGNLMSAGNEDIFLVKFNSAGIHQWSKRFGDGSSQRPSAIAADAANNVTIICYYQGTINFGGINLTSVGSYDIALAQFNSAGTHTWSQRFGDSDLQFGIDVTVDGSSNVIITGEMYGTVNFGGVNLVSAGDADAYLAKFNSAGVHQWSRRYGDVDPQRGQAVGTDASDNVVLAGYFSGTVNYGGSDLVSPITDDISLATFNSAGVHQWSQQFGTPPSNQYVQAVDVDPAGTIVMVGQFAGTVNFGGTDLVSLSNGNMYIANFNAAGTHRWSKRFGDVNFQNPYAVRFGPTGDVIMTGHYTGAVSYGGATFTAGVSDVFLVKFGGETAEPEILDIVDVGNDQGRRVRIQFAPSGGDDPVAEKPVSAYEAYRRIDALPLAATLARGTDSGALLPPGDWEFAGSIPAHAEDDYFMVTPTLADSTVASGQHYSVFFIRAATGTPSLFYDSLPDSGYSLDNLAPGIPGGFAYSAGQLTWNESTASDFDYFSVYGSSTNSFASATLIDYTVAPELDVTATPYAYYFATATDFSGNEGKPATTQTTTDVGGTPKGYVLSISSYPNPFNPETTIRYTVPSKGRVEVSIFDLRGAHVATLVDEEKDAGAYTHAWDGRDTGGTAASSGVYFARVTHPIGTKSYKLVLLK